MFCLEMTRFVKFMYLVIARYIEGVVILLKIQVNFYLYILTSIFIIFDNMILRLIYISVKIQQIFGD